MWKSFIHYGIISSKIELKDLKAIVSVTRQRFASYSIELVISGEECMQNVSERTCTASHTVTRIHTHTHTFIHTHTARTHTHTHVHTHTHTHAHTHMHTHTHTHTHAHTHMHTHTHR